MGKEAHTLAVLRSALREATAVQHHQGKVLSQQLMRAGEAWLRSAGRARAAARLRVTAGFSPPVTRPPA